MSLRFTLALLGLTVLLAACDPRPARDATDPAGVSSRLSSNLTWTVDPDGRASRAVPDPAGAAQLVLGASCRSSRCPLVLVSHGRGGQALDGLTHLPLDTLLDALDSQGFALLLSSDAGGETWGNPAALAYGKRVIERAGRLFSWDGRVYTLGLSMGALPATLAAYRRSLGLKVRASAIIAGRVNLQDAQRTSLGRAASIRLAFQGGVPVGYDPVRDFARFSGRRTPLLTVVSPDDTTVASSLNGERLADLARAAGASVTVIRVRGPHLSKGYVSPEIGRRVGEFFKAHP